MENIFVRNVDEKDLRSIDYKIEELKKSDPKGRWNRSKYIRMLIRDDARKELENYEKTQFEIMLKAVLDNQTDIYNTFNQILYLITNGQLPEAMNAMDKLANTGNNK
ncbi:hypothetical protein [Lactobacillus johnsonii]|jgi:hypothetical protein|uniref:Uncharacterized protein n=1 Tax=Lactobacillus johnsonii TaxID=33959 RepID=A0A9X7T7T7_LACJH|nr:hypothetical protein [Lactobacillus johnsonii]QIA88626.1 hypothetical protein FEE39_10310 [Lactobacillus johnsonii]